LQFLTEGLFLVLQAVLMPPPGAPTVWNSTGALVYLSHKKGRKDYANLARTITPVCVH